MPTIILVFFSAVLVNNFVLSQFLGICPFMGVSRKVETAVGMGAAVTFVMTLSSAAIFVAHSFVLRPLGLEYLNTIAFILLIASIVQLVELYMKKASPTLYSALGIFLPLITTNCAVMGAVLINTAQFSDSFLLAVVHGIGAAVGFSVAMVLLASIREKIEFANIPAPFKGFPIALITAGLMAIAFMGFGGMISI